MCLNPLFLRILYLTKVFLNVLRFIIPLALVFKVIIDIYKKVLDPKDAEAMQKVRRRVIAAVIVFLVPTIANLIVKFSTTVSNVGVDNGLSQCMEFANIVYIEEIEKEISDEELAKYLNKKDANMKKYEDRVAAIRAVVESRQASVGVGEYANNKNTIKCGSGSQYNTGLSNAVRSAGYKTREGAVAAALYLSSHIDAHLPYFWSGGHTSSAKTLIGIRDEWGCNRKMPSPGTSAQKPGEQYPYGLDCSGFVNWAIMNGGYYTGSGQQHAVPSTKGDVFTSLGGINLSHVTVANAKGKIKPGDIATKSGHVGMVVEVSDNKFKVAEEKGSASGLVITEHEYKNKSKGFQYIVLMDKFYANYKKSSPLWDGFK